ncbi:MAG: hypothetical protein U9Q21_02510 [Candidatus Auribacterota bacterium]|nr:hypothetical protein [Candidatus Auribacterota bacterium]
MANKSTCRSCGAPVIWATDIKGKKQILDANPKRVYIISTILRDDENVVELRNGFESHFATCPDAGKWRKPVTKRDDSG